MIDIRKIKADIHRLKPDSTLDKLINKEPDKITEMRFAELAPIWAELSREN